MNKLFLLLISAILLSSSNFETKVSRENRAAMENKKIKCRWVCDKKLYKEQKIADAISFYKNSKDYKFTKKPF
ncbi:MAG: hypothetical protein DRG78_12845 [Epsilonproteobacteria bacterium]|nr:MAG: hypothetical protein DRG78_12845 [Campylobacterota bacterium]